MRFFILVINGLGVGNIKFNPRIPNFNTFEDINKRMFIKLPNLTTMGAKNIAGEYLNKPQNVKSCYGKIKRVGFGGGQLPEYLEMMGFVQKKEYEENNEFLNSKLIERLEKKVGLPFLCCEKKDNSLALAEFGEEHIKTGKPILYLSEDHSLQVAGNIKIISLERLYEICEIICNNLKLSDGFSKVIARPFNGKIGSFYRTPERKDFLVLAGEKTLLNKLSKKVKIVMLNDFGKIFKNVKNISKIDVNGDEDTMAQLLNVVDLNFNGVVFADIWDLVSIGKRCDLVSYVKYLEKVDTYLGQLKSKLNSDDNLIILTNHSNNPLQNNYCGADEYGMVLACGNNIINGFVKTQNYDFVIKNILKCYKIKNFGELNFIKG